MLGKGPGYVPRTDGVVVYLNGGDDLSTPLSGVEKAGGKILVEKDLPLGGSRSYFKETRTFDENLRSLPPDDFADVFDSPAGRYASCGTSGDDLLST